VTAPEPQPVSDQPAAARDDEVAPPGGVPAQPPGRRFDPLSVVVTAVLVGVIIAALHHPRTGMYVACGGLAGGGLLRLVLSPRRAGLLVVRKRRVDVVILLGLALALGVLAAVTPFPAGQG
jgi:hypothetical protein